MAERGIMVAVRIIVRLEKVVFVVFYYEKCCQNVVPY
jgi:hypothetical protein